MKQISQLFNLSHADSKDLKIQEIKAKTRDHIGANKPKSNP